MKGCSFKGFQALYFRDERVNNEPHRTDKHVAHVHCHILLFFFYFFAVDPRLSRCSQRRDAAAVVAQLLAFCGVGGAEKREKKRKELKMSRCTFQRKAGGGAVPKRLDGEADVHTDAAEGGPSASQRTQATPSSSASASSSAPERVAATSFPERMARPAGTRPSVHASQLLYSYGSSDLDAIMGGGTLDY